METYKIVGCRYGNYEGNNWGNLTLLRKVSVENGAGVGYVYVPKEKSKCDFALAVNILKEWDLYENQEVCVTCGLNGRIVSCELAE